MSFLNFAEKCRSTEISAQKRWQAVILPILKTRCLNTEHFPKNYFLWEKDVLRYIESEGIENKEDMDFVHLAKEVFPGQTTLSLHKFVDNFRKNNSHYPNEPLHHVCSRYLDNNPRKKRSLEEKIDRIGQIVRFYEIHKR